MLRIYRLENSHLVMAQEAAEPNALRVPARVARSL